MAKRILLIEDDPFLSSLLKNRFIKEGFEVDLAQTGDLGIKALKESAHDLILLDLILPGKSGFEVMEEINGDPLAPKIPILIISNLGQDSDMEKGKELGAVGYLVKARTSIDSLIGKAKEFLV
ncbi:MAG: response regulator [Gallionella sp.]|nr:response regulator [Gallionella sp.]